MRSGSGRRESFWLWTGESEYEGHLLSVAGTRVLAQVRRRGHFTPAGGAPGTAGPLDLNERTLYFARQVGFGQSPAILAGSLIEFRVTGIQPTRDPNFEFGLCGTFWPVADVHLEALSELESNEAFRYLQKNSSRAFSPSRMGTG